MTESEGHSGGGGNETGGMWGDEGHLTVLCAHLKERQAWSAEPYDAADPSLPEPFRVTLAAGETAMTVVFCPACAGAQAAAPGDPQALRIVAMSVLRQELEARLGGVIGGIGEIVKLLHDQTRTEREQGLGLGPAPHLGLVRDSAQRDTPRHDPPRRVAPDSWRPIGRRIGDAAHPHWTPGLLALELDEGGNQLEGRVYRRVTTCGVCREALDELSRWLAVLDHFDPVVGQEFVTRHDFFNQLLADYRSHPERLEAIRSDELFHQWGLCRLLIEESRSCREFNPALSAELAELGAIVASHLDSGFYRPERVADQNALAAAEYGDALRVIDETEVASRQFEIAHEHREAGTGRTRIASGIARLEARLLKDLGRYPEAHELLVDAIAAHEENHQESRTVLDWILESCAEPSEDEVAHGTAQDEAR